MKISEILARKAATGAPLFSFEFFPPKTPKGEESLYQVIDELRDLKPGYVSVTYGAGGSTRDKTIDWVTKIKHEHGVEAMAHLTCVGASRAELGRVVDELTGRGIENILALRGDPPRGDTSFKPAADGFAHASELVSFIRSRGAAVAIGVAGYPDKHIDAPDLESDIRRLKEKVAAGADFIVTQLFFINENYFSWADRLRSPEIGIRIPVIPGIMPITARSQVDKFISMCGAALPESLRRAIEGAKDDDEVTEIGIAHAAGQCRELLASGAPGIHFYTLNKSPATRRVLTSIMRERA